MVAAPSTSPAPAPDSDDADPDPGLLEAFRRFGDRTSSFRTLGPGFETFRPTEARGASGAPAPVIRYVPALGGRHWVAACEPLADADARVDAALSFFETARASGLRPVMLPVGAGLSLALTTRGCHRLQVGAEPVFDLFEVFAGPDPLLIHPRARALARKGVEVVELEAAQLAPGQPDRAALDETFSAWQAALRAPGLGFLSRAAPFEHLAWKRVFALRVDGRVEAFAGAVPVPAVQGWYFSDIVRRPKAKAGTMELLLLTAMRRLYASGAAEVRLGMAPLADLDPRQTRSPAGRVLAWAAQRRVLYDFRGNAVFKRKLQPTRWEPLYLVTPTPPTLSTLRAVLDVHLPGGVVHALSQTWAARPVEAVLRPDVALRPWPASSAELAARTRLTVAFVGFCLLLHVLRLSVPAVAELHRASAFVPGAPTLAGVFLGPLWHNHLYHLFGDLLSFLIFGGLLELLTGRALYGAATAAGLWLSNPLTMLLAAGPLATLWPEGWQNFLHEVDYGSSNAIYAFVGALAAFLRRPWWLLVPFFLNGVWVCVANESWLALHHHVALFAGYLSSRFVYLPLRARTRNR
jgi:hypothetical protein